jgi:PAS domain S-box-containing protein
VEHAPYGVFVADGDGMYVEVNPAATRITGYTESELLAMGVRDLVTPGHLPLAAANLQSLRDGAPQVSSETAFRHKNGEPRIWHVSAVRLTDDRFLGFVDDITDHRRAERETYESEQRFKRMLAIVPDMISIHDPDMNILYSNWQGFATVPEESRVEGTKCYRTYRGSDAICPDCRAREVLESRRPFREEILLPEGIWVDLRVIPIVDDEGRVEAFMEWVRDITERKAAESAIRDSEERFRLLLEDIPRVAIQSYAPDGTTRYWNRASTEVYGYTPEEAVGRSLLDLIVPPEDREQVRSDVRQMASTGVPIAATELSLMRKDGTRVDVFSSHHVLKRRGREPELFCIDVDLTEIKRAERERKDLQAQLDRSHRLESVGRLAGGVAHDFNNLLMGIMNYVDLCRERVGSEHPIREWLDEITQDAQHSARIVHQLLAFARQQTIAPRVIDLNGAVKEMLTMLGRLIGEGIDLVWDPGTDLWPVRLDPAQVDQILANLATNARDAMGGGGRLVIETRNVRVDEDQCRTNPEAISGEFVLLSVSDSGCGMDRETLECVFEPFFTTREREGGTGLGLATIYGIVRQNHGFVNVYSEPGQGTIFRIYLPRHRGGDAGFQRPVQEPSSVRGGRETILLVEDEKSIRITSQFYLQSLGYSVLSAEAPAEALRLVAECAEDIQVLITDVVMPGMSGRELAAELKKANPDLEVIYMSGYTANVIVHQGVLEEGVDFLHAIAADPAVDKANIHTGVRRRETRGREQRVAATEVRGHGAVTTRIRDTVALEENRLTRTQEQRRHPGISFYVLRDRIPEALAEPVHCLPHGQSEHGRPLPQGLRIRRDSVRPGRAGVRSEKSGTRQSGCFPPPRLCRAPQKTLTRVTTVREALSLGPVCRRRRRRCTLERDPAHHSRAGT